LDPDKNFECLLDYELRQCVRHRRYLSVVMLSLKNGRQELSNMIRSRMRQSDVISLVRDITVVMMGGTDKPDAVNAVSRYGSDFNGTLDMRGPFRLSPMMGRPRQS
jgi:hypothetical protein